MCSGNSLHHCDHQACIYSKFVLPSQKSLEIIINKKKKIIIIIFKKNKKNGGCPLIRVCSLIRWNTVSTFLRLYFVTNIK